MVAGEGFELPKGTKSLRSCRTTSGLSLRATLRCPKNASAYAFLAFFDRCGTQGFTSSATGGVKS